MEIKLSEKYIQEKMKEKILAGIRQALRDGADEKVRESAVKFFKEGIQPYGLKSQDVAKIAKTAWGASVKALPKQAVFELCEELWRSNYQEEAGIACIFTEALHKQYEPADFAVFERWLKSYVNNWAKCDTLCNHTIGDLVTMYPEYIGEVKGWAYSSSRWVKRAAAVTLIIPARKGLFLGDIFEIADMLLLDGDDLVQKGYGWMLKAASMSESFVKGSPETKKEHLDAVFNYVMKHRAVMPRTALRYAIEKMPQELRARVMEK